MLGTSVAMTCHRICEMTAVRLPHKSLAVLWKEALSSCPQPRQLSLSPGGSPCKFLGVRCPLPLLPLSLEGITGHLLLSPPTGLETRGKQLPGCGGKRSWWVRCRTKPFHCLSGSLVPCSSWMGSNRNLDVSDLWLLSIIGEKLASDF